MRKLFIASFLLVFFFNIQAQDRLFSQFYASPLTLNPALTGAFEGKFRVSSIYRDQWRQALDEPYQTFSSALDLRWRMGKDKSRHKDHAAVGVMFFQDKAGAVNFSTTQISISGAYHKALDIRSTQFLSLGFQAGIVQRNLNFGNITFEDQFNGTTGYSDPSQERLPENNFSFGDFSVGLNYAYAPRSSKFRFFIGGAIHHFQNPTVSFYHKTDSESLLPDNKLAPRYSAQLSAQVPVSKGITFLPRAIFDSQGSSMKLDAGGNFRLALSDFRLVSLHLGSYLRPVTDYNNSLRLDAVVALVGVEFNNILIGTSYDFHVGSTAGFNRGTFEMSVAYLGEYEDDLILCPKF
ncbi:MAG: PorP/SprF family type IX secretion system membrane protein [Saprospiraceae bacterium]|nr:PorP/SprF family type IX secretion system membrane protein [Saprospiraceae bacterium]MCF8250483.1 PorP/SprF family type IX secretion system membrane protein [Saprospiraceae bacterium]MCF8281988.1 PorP/SprF family type IX secretion system membrane protein [Bacteroidales bacterium]MCF8312371.1 PorP/SprF family type IX secretion system membrane protein [Saprospiraceae bacterium]MCF8440632.1 PorP/SprF family type IX secretion system membrane protein [Saprospiraceae bacterium]